VDTKGHLDVRGCSGTHLDVPCDCFIVWSTNDDSVDSGRQRNVDLRPVAVVTAIYFHPGTARRNSNAQQPCGKLRLINLSVSGHNDQAPIMARREASTGGVVPRGIQYHDPDWGVRLLDLAQ
jgi:hypothetical protein